MPENGGPQMTLESLRSVPLFASLDDEAAGALRGLLEHERKPAGSVLFRKGEPGGAMYLIEGGRVRIHIHDDDGARGDACRAGGRRLLRRDGHPRRQAALGDGHRLGGRAPRRALARGLPRLRQPHAAGRALDARRHHRAAARHGRHAAPARHAQPQRGGRGAPDRLRPDGRTPSPSLAGAGSSSRPASPSSSSG